MSLQKEDCLFLKMIPKSRQQPNNEAIEVSREARRSRDHVNFTYSRASCLAQLVLLVFPALPSSAPPWQLPLSPCRVIMSENASQPKGRLTRGDMLQGHVAGKNYLGCLELLFRIIESTVESSLPEIKLSFWATYTLTSLRAARYSARSSSCCEHMNSR